RGQLRAAVQGIEQTQRPTRVEVAFSLASSLANPTRSTDDSSVRPANVEPGKERTYVAAEGIATEVHLFSDGRFPDMSDFSLGNLNIHFHTAGKPGAENVNNVGIVTFNALRDEQDSNKLLVFARAMNFCKHKVDTKVRLEVFVNDRLSAIKDKDLSLPPR